MQTSNSGVRDPCVPCLICGGVYLWETETPLSFGMMITHLAPWALCDLCQLQLFNCSSRHLPCLVHTEAIPAFGTTADLGSAHGPTHHRWSTARLVANRKKIGCHLLMMWFWLTRTWNNDSLQAHPSPWAGTGLLARRTRKPVQECICALR